MRKSKTPSPPAPFVYLRDVLPELAKSLSLDLRKIGERALAEQVSDLKIYGRCCNSFPCGRFYCVPQEERQEPYRRGLTRNVGLELIVAKDKIVEIETLLPEVDAVLQRVFPNAENDDQETILLKVEPDSLRRSGMGTISGRIYLQTDAGGFPEVGWDDIVVPVLCALAQCRQRCISWEQSPSGSLHGRAIPCGT